ncbi:multiple inositol polyphosphate phosphatase 1-like [Planococcus citri]|uniref:multiple inositol polyphosphate phosphatase 1-like n=1 Tax=Planococcus citri TaxID=170843 RepID=UPI0031FA06DD
MQFKMNRIIQSILISVSILYIKGDDSDYCYSKDTSPYKYFSEWTSYDIVKGATVIEQGCSPIYVWGLVKHGVKSLTNEQLERNKLLSDLKKDIIQNNKEKRCTLCSDDFQNINNWDNSLTEKQNEDLSKIAYTNHETFATYLTNYIDSTTQKPTKDNFEFRTSKVTEAAGSALKFTNKLLGTSSEKAQDNGVTENNVLLRAKSDCSKWSENNKERDDFISTPIYQAMSYRISNRLGFKSQLPFDKILAMYESCVIGNTLSTTTKPAFCAAFLQEDMKVMEYREDLKHYYTSGYGSTLSEKIGCPLVKDMVDKLSKASTGNLEGKKGAFYFADDENVMGMVTKLGLYRDEEPIKHDNYQFQSTNRKWRSSSLSPYTATMHAIVFNCANNEKKVEFYHNQNVVKFDACKSSTGNKCPLDTFLTEVKKTIAKDDKCEEDYCDNKSSGAASNMMGYSFIVMVVCFLFSRL